VTLPDDLDLTGVEGIRRMFGEGPADPGKEIDLPGYGYSWLRLVDEHVTTAII
jgi:hypothetical protein